MRQIAVQGRQDGIAHQLKHQYQEHQRDRRGEVIAFDNLTFFPCIFLPLWSGFFCFFPGSESHHGNRHILHEIPYPRGQAPKEGSQHIAESRKQYNNSQKSDQHFQRKAQHQDIDLRNGSGQDPHDQIRQQYHKKNRHGNFKGNPEHIHKYGNDRFRIHFPQVQLSRRNGFQTLRQGINKSMMPVHSKKQRNSHPLIQIAKKRYLGSGHGIIIGRHGKSNLKVDHLACHLHTGKDQIYSIPQRQSEQYFLPCENSIGKNGIRFDLQRRSRNSQVQKIGQNQGQTGFHPARNPVQTEQGDGCEKAQDPHPDQKADRQLLCIKLQHGKPPTRRYWQYSRISDW